MATSPDGILEAAFDPARNLTRLVVDGGMWPVPGVLRTNLAPNPLPASTSGWVTSAADSLTWIASDDGAPCLEASDANGAGSLYVDPSTNRATPVAGQWVAFAAEVKALDATTAGAMRLRINGYDGTTVAGGTTAQPVTTTSYNRLAVTAQAATGGGYVRTLIWPTASTPTTGGFRFRRAVVAVAGTEAEALAAVESYFDGDTPPSGSIFRYWTGTPNASSSVEELIAGPVSRVLIERSSPGVASEPVRTANGIPVAGGWWLGSDEAAPMDTTATYTAEGYGGGALVATATVAVDTSGAVWGPWLKSPGHPERTVQVPLAQLGDTPEGLKDVLRGTLTDHGLSLPCPCDSGRTYRDCHIPDALPGPCLCGSGKTLATCCLAGVAPTVA